MLTEEEGLWGREQQWVVKACPCQSLSLPGFMTTPPPVTKKIRMKEESERKIKSQLHSVQQETSTLKVSRK